MEVLVCNNSQRRPSHAKCRRVAADAGRVWLRLHVLEDRLRQSAVRSNCTLRLAGATQTDTLLQKDRDRDTTKTDTETVSDSCYAKHNTTRSRDREESAVLVRTVEPHRGSSKPGTRCPGVQQCTCPQTARGSATLTSLPTQHSTTLSPTPAPHTLPTPTEPPRPRTPSSCGIRTWDERSEGEEEIDRLEREERATL
eukprot:13811-Rhodomonas_salina.5